MMNIPQFAARIARPANANVLPHQSLSPKSYRLIETSGHGFNAATTNVIVENQPQTKTA